MTFALVEFSMKRRISWRTWGVTWLLSAMGWSGAAFQARADDPDNCLLCHQFRGLSRFDEESSRAHLYYTNPDYSTHRLGPHARLACTDCHERSEVGKIPHAPTTPVDCTRQCHLSNPDGPPRPFSHDNIPRMLERSAHTPDVLSKVNFAEGPLLNPGQATCLYCHDEPIFRESSAVFPRFTEDAGQVFDRCDVCHVEKVPVDIEYYTRHVASRFQPARSTLETAQVCAVCHADPLVMKEHELSNTVASYVRSFHGKAALLGDTTTASCISCHIMAGENAHLMLGQQNPHSSVNEANVADSCRNTACHPGASKALGENAVHLDLPTARGTWEFTLAAVFIVLTIFTFGPSAMLVLLDLLQSVVGREHHADLRSRELVDTVLKHPEGPERLKRFTPRHRISHWVLSILFTLLVLTGFPMKFPEQAWAAWMIASFGGLSIARVLHHWSGILLILGFMLHIVDIFVVFFQRASKLKDEHGHGRWYKAWVALPMWISPTDLKKTLQLFAYLLFLTKNRPTFGRFSPAEKFEYLGVFWGTILLGVTGGLLWGEQLSSKFLSGRALNLATIAHTYEAFLALIHVGILHIYNVMLAPKVFPLSRATLTGETPAAKLAEEHGEMVDEVARDLGINPAGHAGGAGHG